MDLRSRSVNAKGGRGRGGAARTLKPNGVSKRNHINKVKQKRGNKRSVVARVGSAIQQISSEETPTTAVVEETPDFLPQEEDQLPEIDPNLVVFDQDFVYAHLSELNERTEPVLKLTELSLVCEQAVEKVQHLFGWPVAEVWEETWLVLLQDLFWAKFPGAKPIEATVCESVEEVLGTENKEKRQVHADLAEEGVGEIDWGDEERIDWGDERYNNMATPMLGQFLNAINGFIKVKNEAQLADWLVLEPPFSNHYLKMVDELKSVYPKGSEEALEQKCTQIMSAAREGEDGASWTQFIKFMVQYLNYLRDVTADPDKYLHTYGLLSELQIRVNSALTHGTLGYLVLPVVVSCARLVCRLAIGLDRQPELIAHLQSAQPGGEDGGQRETLPERAANTLRAAFVTCLNDKTSGLNREGKPEGKKRGIYTIANLCLKILYQCRKTRNATQIFENIYNSSPPLSAYSKRERVTYLYYLGRFLFQNSHFYRAQLALQYAYDESPARPECVRQRRYILVYLIASNIILGRFPSQELLNRPEAQGFTERFLPLCYAIRSGDLATFRRHLDLDGEHADWFLHFRILLQLRNRCEILVWRSLVRKTFLLAGTTPTDPNSRSAATISIHDITTVFTLLEKRAYSPNNATIDPDFEGLDIPEDDGMLLPDTTSIESILSSLLEQGFLGGFISHKQLKYAVKGTKAKGGALANGFPVPWEVIRRKAESESEAMEVPGWKKEGGKGGGGPGPGQVIHLSGARPVGAAG